jgi:hypothetical protein
MVVVRLNKAGDKSRTKVRNNKQAQEVRVKKTENTYQLNRNNLHVYRYFQHKPIKTYNFILLAIE